MFRFYVTDHYVKNVRVWRFSGPYFPAFGLNTERISVKGFEKYTFPILGYLWSFFVYNKSKKKNQSLTFTMVHEVNFRRGISMNDFRPKSSMF